MTAIAKEISNNDILIRKATLEISKAFSFNKIQERLLSNVLHEVTKNMDITINIFEVGTFEYYIDAYLDSKKLEGYSSTTLEVKRYTLKSIDRFLGKNLEDITISDLKSFLLSKDCKVVTLNNIITTMKSFFGFLCEEGYIDKNPANKLKVIKTEKRLKKSLNEINLEMIRGLCSNKRDRALIEFGYATGLRVSEIIRLNKDDIDWYSNSFRVIGKGNKERIVLFSDTCKYYLTEYLQSRKDDNSALFVSLKKPYERLTRSGVFRIFERLKKESGLDIDFSPHILRHTFATKLAETADITIVQKLLGHENINTTMVYAEVNKDKLSYQYKSSKL